MKHPANQLFDSAFKRMEYLHFRWECEKEYEDFDDYVAEMRKECAKVDGCKFVKGTKRPFGFHFLVEGGRGYFRVAVNRSEYKIQRFDREKGWK